MRVLVVVWAYDVLLFMCKLCFVCRFVVSALSFGVCLNFVCLLLAVRSVVCFDCTLCC